MLDVPVTLETGVEGMNVNFYDPAGRFDYGIGYDMNALEVASDVHDCRTIEQGEGEEYKVNHFDSRHGKNVYPPHSPLNRFVAW